MPQDKNYDLYQYACKVTARRFFPNFINLDATFNQHEKWKADDPNRYYYECATMGCRTRVMGNHVDPDKAITPGRGNLSFTSINLPRLGIKHGIVRNDKTDMKGFYEELGVIALSSSTTFAITLVLHPI